MGKPNIITNESDIDIAFKCIRIRLTRCHSRASHSIFRNQTLLTPRPPKMPVKFNNTEYWADPNTTSKYSFAEGTTGPPCLLLLQQAGLAPFTGREDLVIIDQACGTGITSQLLWEVLGDEGKRNATLKCGDFSAGMVASVKERMDRLGWGKQGSAAIIDASMDTKLPSVHFTHVIINFGINVVPDSNAALKGYSLLFL